MLHDRFPGIPITLASANMTTADMMKMQQDFNFLAPTYILGSLHRKNLTYSIYNFKDPQSELTKYMYVTTCVHDLIY